MRALGWIHTWRWPLALLLALGVWLCMQPAIAWAACGDGGTICVDMDAPGPGHDGLTWTTAYTNVQDALAVAVPGNQIWVAEGVYYPDEGSGQTNDDRASTFTLRNGVALYGGFAGNEEQLAQRDWTAHVTVLSGDIDKNDADADGNRIAETWNDLVDDNAYNVVTGGGVTETARLDGFTVTAGYANGTSSLHRCGGGMLNRYSSPTLTNVTFSGNRANFTGGGMDNEASSPTLTHVTFSGNQATNAGGGMYNDYSSPTLTHVTFSGNQSDYGGGMDNDSSNPTLTNVTFSGNRADDYGGGMYNYDNSPTLTNVTFSGNQATNAGGGMYNDYSSPTLVNCILWGDSATDGSEIYNDGSSSPVITYSAIQGWSGGGTGNLARDPQFVAPVAASSAPTTTGNYRLREDSPAIDAGDPATCPPDDLDDQPRVDLRCDMGAYERQYRDGDTVIKRDFTGGTPYSFGPTWVSVTLSAADTGALTVTKHITYPGGTCDAGELPATWHITSALSEGLPITVSFCYTPELASVIDAGSLRAFRWDSDAMTWTLPISTGLAVDEGCVTLSGIEAFSAWTLKDVSAGEDTPTAARVVGLVARGFAPVAALLALGGATASFRRRRR